MNIKKLTILSLLTAVSLILGYIESLIPVNISLPGVKLGLSNIAVLLAIYLLGRQEGFFVLTAKVLLSAILFSGFTGALYSAAGGLFSLVTMCLLYKSRFFSAVGVSTAGAAAHNAGQILIALLLTGSTAIINYFPILLFAGTIFGFAVGIAAHLVIYSINKNKILNANLL